MNTISLKKIIAIVAIILAMTGLWFGWKNHQKKPEPKPLPPPKVKKEEMKPHAPVLIGTYTTLLPASSSRARTKNIETTIGMINNSVINPGAEFSFNRKIGAVTEEKGFVYAPIYDDNGQVKPGLGGGMCQVSSTLYNAVLQAGLQVLERHPHSKPVNYVPAGRDATVYDDKDFRFRNNKNAPIRIYGAVRNNKVTVDIYQLADAK